MYLLYVWVVELLEKIQCNFKSSLLDSECSLRHFAIDCIPNTYRFLLFRYRKKNHICQSSLRSYCSNHFYFSFLRRKNERTCVCARVKSKSIELPVLSTYECVWFMPIDAISPVAFIEFWFEWVNEEASEQIK